MRSRSLAGVAAAVMGLAGACARPVSAGEGCTAADNRVVVDLTRHTLTLCANSQVVDSFGVRLGRGGVGKTREGDGKTPVGTYPLAEPRPSDRYGTFIPIGYPTEEQKKNGYTGSAVGVHGPARWVKWLGRLVNTFDSSDGCVGVATDADMDRITQWVRTTRVRTIELK